MKVLHVIPSVGPARGGPSFLLRTLTGGLAESGIEVHVAATDDNGGGVLNVRHGVPTRDGGVTYRYFPRQTPFYTVSLPLNRWLSLHVADYGLVHIHALFSFATVSAAFWARRRGIPYIIRPLGTLNRWGMANRRRVWKRLSFRFIESRILRRAAFIHYTSEQERVEAAELGVNSRSEIIPNALPNTVHCCAPGHFRERYPHLRKRKIVLFFSRFDPKKGLDLLLPAFAQVQAKDPEATLVLAGSGTSEFVAGLADEAVLLGIASNVVWAGFVTDIDKQALLSDADIFVLPSYSENFGIAALEAMAAGIPVIVSDQVAIHKEIAAAQAGLVVPCEIEPLKKAMLELLADPRLRKSMGQNGKCLAQERYSLPAVTGKLVGLYEEITK